MKSLLLIAVLIGASQAGAQCFELWGPTDSKLDSICFSGGDVKLLADGEVKYETHAQVQDIGAHTAEHPGLSGGIFTNVPDSIQYTADDIELDVTVPVHKPQGIHTRYGELVFQNQQYTIGQ